MQPLLPRSARKGDSWLSLSSESGIERTVGLSGGSYVVPDVIEQGLGPTGTTGDGPDGFEEDVGGGK